MTTPRLERVDHLHVHVSDRAAAERWYAETLGFTRLHKFEEWANGDGPLMIADPSGAVQLALFQRPIAPSRSTIALRTGASDFLEWRRHLNATQPAVIEPVDHGLAWSLYFTDPDGNPYEITSYEYESISRVLHST